jgi:hypothetical protein
MIEMKRIFQWVGFNAFIAVVVYFGIIKHMEGVDRIAYFVAWTVSVASFFKTGEKTQAEMRERGRPVPAWINVSFDIGIAFVFIWSAAWITGSLYFFHMVLQQGCWLNALKDPEEKEGD